MPMWLGWSTLSPPLPCEVTFLLSIYLIFNFFLSQRSPSFLSLWASGNCLRFICNLEVLHMVLWACAGKKLVYHSSLFLCYTMAANLSSLQKNACWGSLLTCIVNSSHICNHPHSCQVFNYNANGVKFLAWRTI